MLPVLPVLAQEPSEAIQKAHPQPKVSSPHPQSQAREPPVLAQGPPVLARGSPVRAQEPPVLARERRREVASELARHRLAAREVVAVGPRS